VRTLVAHARSAFRDEGIELENNMPFLRGDRAFIFNGELSGVRLGVEGRTGAEKIFSLIGQMDRGDLSGAISRTLSVLERRSARIRACNFVVAEPGRFHVHSLFDGEAAYFTLFKRTWDGETILCSGMYPTDQGEWVPVANGSQEAVPCSS
jgi:glutamine amidotransferase